MRAIPSSDDRLHTLGGANIAGGQSRPVSSSGGSRTRAARTPADSHSAQGTRSLPVTLFILSLFLPFLFSVGSLELSPFRLVLLASVLPCLYKWASGGAGRLRFADFTLLLYCFWCFVSLCAVHGVSQGLQSGGIQFIETMGPYLLARCYIRSAEDYYRVTRLFYRVILFLMPFAFFEALTGENILLDLMRHMLTTHPNLHDTRWGLRRVQSVVEHPILFGVICGAMLGPVYCVLGYAKTAPKRYAKAAVIATTTFLSMSSGPISGLFAQIVLIAWDKILVRIKARWKLLWAGLGAGYVVVATMSNQSVFEFFITHFSFSPENAYYRVLIWNFGTGSVMNHPLFGTTMMGWDRPDWMPPSIDMFWLYQAIIYGIPAAALMLLTFLAIFVAVAIRKIDDVKLAAYRMGFLASLTGFFLVGWTVHFWNATYVIFIFSLGAGVWLLDVKGEENAEGKTTQQRPAHGAMGRSLRAGLKAGRPSARPSGRKQD
ncbi:O-antigen ligase domain-containing protein [Shinella sp. CPCC 101442]|uniref:O-antigen ligase family protein n=1 Tax=Shinella sp. CPCC 101442 TaxID=2932265 RepID=UPI002152DB94|nr:O-antigen ligase domain-containing protein [Shinella sp. CPCC 101442]MCR6502416.1 O-antigen ligase domain-containing protein [Shinella sp. CPCC 101442]